MREIVFGHMCVNGASGAAGGSGWSAYKRYRVIMYFSFFCGNGMVWGCDGFWGAIGGKKRGM